MAQVNISPPSVWIKVVEKIEEDLCWQLAFEQVIINYQETLAPEIIEELRTIKDGKALLTDDGFAIDTLIRRNLYGVGTIEEAEKRLNDIEASLLGFSYSLMGNRVTTNPNVVNNQFDYSRLPESSGAWLFRFREKVPATYYQNRQSDIFANSAVKKWLKQRFEAGKGFRALEADALALLHDFIALVTEGSEEGLIYGSEITTQRPQVLDLLKKARGGAFSGDISRTAATDQLFQNQFFLQLYTTAAQIVRNLFFGVGGSLNPDGTVTTTEGSIIKQDCIDRNIDAIIRSLVGEIPGQIRERQRQLENDPFNIRQAITSRPEELTLLQKYEPPKLTPFDFQCFLLENISKLVDERERGSFSSDYKHIVKVSNNGDPGSVINTIEHGTRNQYIEEFLNICPEVYGLLVPYLKISRIEYDDVGNVKLDRNGRSVEKDLKIPNFLTQDDIQNILDGAAGRAPGAGIKSFSWALDGVQPAEVDNNISATLVMYFQSVNDFFNGARRAGQDEPNFLDLIINSPAVKKLKDKKRRKQKPGEKPCSDDLLNKKLHQDYQGHNFRVKICAGWATPPKEALVQLTKSEDKADKLIKAFDDSRISLFLQMTQHTLNFAQNGTLELSVRYQASLAGLLTGKTADIFDVTPKSVKQDIERQENKIESISEGEQSDSDKEAKKEALEEIKLLKNIDRNVKYKKLLKRVFGSPATSKIFNISLNPLELTQTPYKDLSPEDRQKRVKRRQSETLQFQTIQSLNKDVLDAINKNQGATGKDTGKAYSDIASKRFKDLTSEDKINIPFFFLGDLLDTVIEEIKSNNQKNPEDGVKPLNFHMFMSDVEMIDPLQAFKVKNLEDLINCGYDLRDITFLDAVTKENPTDTPELNGIYRTMNIGDIPISLDAFQLWFKDNVIKKERNTYFLLYFIKDICNDLITKALSSKCFGKEFNFQQRFDVQPLTLAREEAKNCVFTPNRTYSAKKVGSAQAAVRCELDPAQTELGLLMYPTDSRPKRLLGSKSYKSDTKRGIYHHFLGSACGLVKTINFSRQDQAYLRESRIQKEGALGAEQLRELYSANIDLVGNTLYKNGMYIYINPSLLGASEEYLDYLGLHGYYLVTSVKSTITPSSFDVSIGALHEGIEFKDNKRLPTADVGDFATLEAEDPPHSPPRNQDREEEQRIARAAEQLGGGRWANTQALAEAYARGELSGLEAFGGTLGQGLGGIGDAAGAAWEWGSEGIGNFVDPANLDD